jgi:hypothetical protein
VVDDDPLPTQQDVQAPVAEAGTLGGQLPQPGTQRFIFTWPASLAYGRSARSHQTTCPPLGEPQLLLRGGDGCAPLGGPHQFFRRSSLRA